MTSQSTPTLTFHQTHRSMTMYPTTLIEKMQNDVLTCAGTAALMRHEMALGLVDQSAREQARLAFRWAGWVLDGQYGWPDVESREAAFVARVTAGIRDAVDQIGAAWRAGMVFAPAVVVPVIVETETPATPDPAMIESFL